MATPSSFSYAQAAKGQAAPSSNTAPPDLPAQAQSTPSAPATVKVHPSAEKTTDSPDLDPSSHPATSSSTAEKQDVESRIDSGNDLSRDIASEILSTEPRKDEDAALSDFSWRRIDKETAASTIATLAAASATSLSVTSVATARSLDDLEAKRSRKGKKARDSDSFVNEPAPLLEKDQEPQKMELSEAPIPPVNIWQQRKEAQLAKVKPSTITPDDTISQPPAQADETKRTAKSGLESPRAPSFESAPTNGAKLSSRKTTDLGRTDRTGPRTSRSTEKEAKDGKTELPPPVEDAASWPTPETAIKEEKKKPLFAQADRVEKDGKDHQEETTHSKSRPKEKWVAYDYVPSVNFETQLPQMRNSKPRGGARGPNGTRAPAGSHSTADRSSSAAPGSKSSEMRDRPREAVTTPGRVASSSPVKRVSMDASSVKDQKKVAGQPGADKVKDSVSAYPPVVHGIRDRPEGRGDRGRGGFRGRGGHHVLNTHVQHQHAAAGFAAPGSIPTRPQGPYSPPPRHGGHNPIFVPPPQRGGRGRNGAGGNFHRMSLPNGASRLPPLQTQPFGPFDYPMASMPVMPYQPQPYWDSVVMSLLKNQIEYYFSIENLCKDMYLRKRMDSQGFVNLHFVAAFKRIRELTSEMGMIRAVCESSTELDYVVAEDEIERLRRRSGWQSFVLPMEDRDDFARNNGPTHLTFKNRGFGFGLQYGSLVPTSYGASPPLGYPHGHGDLSFQPFPANGLPLGQGMNGIVNGSGLGQGVASQLSADVPDFSPSGSVLAGGATANFEQSHVFRPSRPGTGKEANLKSATVASDGPNGLSGESASHVMSNGVYADATSGQGDARS